MDEDVERFRATTKKFALTIVRAFQDRFPNPNEFETNIIVNSLSSSLLSFLMTLNHEERNRFIVMLINMLLEVRDYD